MPGISREAAEHARFVLEQATAGIEPLCSHQRLSKMH
jgi:hypothetical protein